VVLSAEDDYGISRVELFRSLNDSRSLPMDLRLARRPPRRAYDTVYLPLDGYGLTPGDTIKLFGRVEDNDPAGVKGSESAVVTVHVISQEEFERLLRAKRGIEVLLSKYREARRRMEAAAQEMEGLRKKLRELPPDSPVADAIRKQLARLAQQLRRDADELRKSAEHPLPYDADKNLTEKLKQLADSLASAGRLMDELGSQDLRAGELAAQLEKLAQKLGAEREKLQREAVEPLEYLAEVYPLIADQARFVALVLRQQDLAERAASLKGHDGEDDPALKTRMRDLEEEQRAIREELGTLLDDILDHVERLPDDEKLDPLRETAAEFVKDVRESGAAEAMSEAESALSEFLGTKGAQKTKDAADILARFVKKCQGMGNMAGSCLVFQPSLSACLGNTVSQLLALQDHHSSQRAASPVAQEQATVVR